MPKALVGLNGCYKVKTLFASKRKVSSVERQWEEDTVAPTNQSINRNIYTFLYSPPSRSALRGAPGAGHAENSCFEQLMGQRGRDLARIRIST